MAAGPQQPDATIIIPQFNHSELTRACIRSLRRHDRCPWPVIVVDDGSSAANRHAIATYDFPATRLIEQPHRGVSAAWNNAAAFARTKFLVFLNNDVVATGPFVSSLIKPLANGTSVLSGIRTRRETQLPVQTLCRLPTTKFLEGWCLATTREAFQRVGGFDETMALYWSDTDFQARMIHQHSDLHAAMTCSPRLPIRHLKHRTAHDLPDYKHIWREDRSTFIAK